MRYRLLLCILPLVTILSASEGTAVKADFPNVIIILTDDQGYGDVGVFGAAGYETPNLDRMASQGMRFTNYYSGSGVCSPSRAALLTGCYPPRVGITKVLFPFDSIGINSDELTIAELLKDNGYSTAAIGKWHLGHHYEFLPLQHGFDEYYGLPYSNDMWGVHYDGTPVTEQNTMRPWKLNAPPLVLMESNDVGEELTSLEDQNSLTTKYTERAVAFIKQKRAEPFFLYLAHSMPHVPLGVSSKFDGKSQQGTYGDVIMEIDWSVGEIVMALKESGIEDNTLIIFTSDNGPWLNYGNHGGSAGGLREGKGTPFEGGFRVPSIMKWPRVIEAGKVCNHIASSIDVLPTIAEIVGADLPQKIDGVSLLRLLKGDFSDPPRHEYYYYSGKNLNAVRIDQWKLVLPFSFNTNVGSQVGMDGWPGKTDNISFEGGLFNLRRDPGERYDVKLTHPEVVERLEKVAQEMRTALGDNRNNIVGRENRAPGSAY